MTADARFDPTTARLHLVNPSRCVEVTGWPNPQGWVKTESGQQACRPRLSIRRALCPPRSGVGGEVGDAHQGQTAFPFRPFSTSAEAFRDYWLSYPSEVIAALSPLPGNHSFHLAEWCAAGGLELLGRLPALGFMASLRSPRELSRLSRLSDGELAATLGFKYPSTDRALDVVAKVPAAAVGTHTVKLLRKLLSRQVLTAARVATVLQQKRVNVGVLRLLLLPAFEEAVDAWLVSWVGDQHAEDRVGITAQKIELALKLEEIVGQAGGVTFRSGRQIDEYLDRMRQLAGTWRFNKGPRFPAPPLSDVCTIPFTVRAIRSAGALRAEADMMQSSRGYAADEVFTGCSYFYRLLRPERVTIQLMRLAQGLWVVQEARARGDSRPQRATLALITYWLSVQQGSWHDDLLPDGWSRTFRESSAELTCGV